MKHHVVPESLHDELVHAAFLQRGYDNDESRDMVRLCREASRHGVRTHNAVKALDLEKKFGAKAGGCVPGAKIKVLPSKFPAAQIWNANQKLGATVAWRAIETCIKLADQYGTGTVSVDNAWHYLWGGGYALEAARKGYIAYTNCTAMLAEVVPFGGTKPTLGTNPHTWAFPTTESVGFPVLIDWATSVVSMGRVQQLKREGKILPPGCALDSSGGETSDPNSVAALLPFGAHKGYGLGLVDELFAAFIGGSIPTARGHFAKDGEKHTCCFFFQVIHPEAISGRQFARNRTAAENVSAIVKNILGEGNSRAILPGQNAARWAKQTAEQGGLLFSEVEFQAFDQIAAELGMKRWSESGLKQIEI